MSRYAVVLLFVSACSACSGSKNIPKTDLTASPTTSVAVPVASANSDASVALIDAGPPAIPPVAGKDFAPQVKALFRVAACGDDSTVPSTFDTAAVDEHCKGLAQLIADFKKNWMDVAMPFIAKLVPKDAPKTIVYPFGGGDLVSALATYPDALEVTTVSLETASDVRKIDTAGKALKGELGRYRTVLAKLFDKAHSRTDNLDIGSKSVLPGEIVFDLVALTVHGFEPIDLHYFTFNVDGGLDYVEEKDLDAADAAIKAKKKSIAEVDREVFGNMELRFRKKGDAYAPIRTIRHVAYNLDNDHLKDGKLVKHLSQKGKVSAMTKAASHLLWSDDFSTIRNYLFEHTDWMISDSTGPAPAAAKKAGFIQDTYGLYTWPEPFGTVDVKNAEDMKRLFQQNPHTDVTFRYGYPDKDGHGHIVVTRRIKP